MRCEGRDQSDQSRFQSAIRAILRIVTVASVSSSEQNAWYPLAPLPSVLHNRPIQAAYASAPAEIRAQGRSLCAKLATDPHFTLNSPEHTPIFEHEHSLLSQHALTHAPVARALPHAIYRTQSPQDVSSQFTTRQRSAPLHLTSFAFCCDLAGRNTARKAAHFVVYWLACLPAVKLTAQLPSPEPASSLLIRASDLHEPVGVNRRWMGIG